MKELKIFWTRHSISRANVESIFEKMVNNTIFYQEMKDPAIISGGEKCSCEISSTLVKEVRNSRLIGCSEMKRAIQTAIMMFPKKFKNEKIKVLPGVQEIGIGGGNTANEIKENKKILFKWCLDFKNKNYCHELKKILAGMSEKEIKKLIDSLYSDMDNQFFKPIRKVKNSKEKDFLKYLIPYLNSKRIRKIVIVSHSHYIKDNIMVKDSIKNRQKKYLRKGEKMYNNQILEKDYKYNKPDEVFFVNQKIHYQRCEHSKVK